jgi:hypothetical protein
MLQRDTGRERGAGFFDASVNYAALNGTKSRIVFRGEHLYDISAMFAKWASRLNCSYIGLLALAMSMHT